MISLLEKAKELSIRFRGLKATQYLFPEEYAQLNPNLILNDDALQEIDMRLIELLNEHYFPCYDFCYDYQKKTRERPYLGLEKISIVTMGFNSYDYHYFNSGASWYYVQIVSELYFAYYDYNLTALSAVEDAVLEFHDRALEILPDVVKYVWANTGNLWLDSHEEAEFDLIETEVLYLKETYQEAAAIMERLIFFDNWFIDNNAVARSLIDPIFNQLV